MNAQPAKTNTIGLVVGVVVLIGVLVGLYYLYSFLAGNTSGRAATTLFSGTLSFADCRTNKTTAQGLAENQEVTIKGITDGGEFSFSTWLYIADARSSTAATTPAHLFEIGQRDISKGPNDASSNTNRVILTGALVPSSSTLVIRMGTPALSEQLRGSEVVSLLSTSYTNTSKCDILSVEYQRWILVTCVVNSRTLDVYIDGKLARSCVYSQPYTIQPGTTQTATFGLGVNTMKGFFSSPKVANYAMSPNEIWSLYMAGPSTSKGIGDWFSSLFSIKVSF